MSPRLAFQLAFREIAILTTMDWELFGRRWALPNTMHEWEMCVMDPNITAYNGSPTSDNICCPISNTPSQDNFARSAYRFQREMTEHTVRPCEPSVPLLSSQEGDLALETEIYLWFKRNQAPLPCPTLGRISNPPS